MIQAVLPCLAFASTRTVLRMRGGTNVDLAPPLDYFSEVFTSIAKRFGISFTCNLVKRLMKYQSTLLR